MAPTSIGFWSNRSGPGLIPCRISTPIMIAIGRSPGMPSASVGMKAPPATALLEDSEATMPEGVPLPKSSGVLENFFA